MTDRGPDYQIDRFERALDRAKERFDERVDGVADRLNAKLGEWDGKLTQLLADVASGKIERHQLFNQLAELQVQMGENRDLIHRLQAVLNEHTSREVKAAAEGAAVGVAAPAVKSSVKQGFREFFAGPRGWLLTLAATLAAAGTVIDTGPKVARAIDTFWSNITAEPEKTDDEAK